MEIKANSDLLISQWRVADKVRTFTQAQIDIVQEDVANTLDDLERMLDVDTAEGVWLDFLAIRVGIERPLLEAPDNLTRFGFRSAQPPAQQYPPFMFDQASFKGDLNSRDRYPMSDFLFRRFVKARGVLVANRGNFESFHRAVNFIDADAECVDNRDMTISIFTNNQQDLEIADEIGALPRPAGVLINYQNARLFGLTSDDRSTKSGDGFDRVRFR